MTATLTFNLPDDQEQFKYATQATDMYAVLWEYDQLLRSYTKYAPDDIPEQVYDAYVAVRQHLHSIMSSHNISFE